MKITRTVTGDEPVTLAEMKQYLRVTHNDTDDLIERLITEVREILETATGRSLVAQTISLETEIDGVFRLPHGPINTITTITVEDDYETVDVSDDVVYDTIDDEGTLVAEYTAGPYECKMAVKAGVEHIYMNNDTAWPPPMVNSWIQSNTMNLWLQ